MRCYVVARSRSRVCPVALVPTPTGGMNVIATVGFPLGNFSSGVNGGPTCNEYRPHYVALAAPTRSTPRGLRCAPRPSRSCAFTSLHGHR